MAPQEIRDWRVRLAAVLCGFVALLGLAVWASLSHGLSWRSGRDGARANGSALNAETPVAPLTRDFDQAEEDVPPRERSAAVLLRLVYRAPPEPFEFLSSHLGTSPTDRLLADDLGAFQTVWRQTGTCKPTAALQERLVGSSLSPEVLLASGRGFDFLVGDELAACFFRAAIARAAVIYRSSQPGDPQAMPFLRELSQTAALWRLEDFPTLEQRFELESNLYPRLSPESRRAAFLHARVIYQDGRYAQAAQAMLGVLQLNREAGDMGAWTRSDVAELDWSIATCFYSARQYAQAIPYFKGLLQTNDARRTSAAHLLVNCFTRTGQLQEARALAARFGFKDPAAPAAQRSAALSGSKARPADTHTNSSQRSLSGMGT